MRSTKIKRLTFKFAGGREEQIDLGTNDMTFDAAGIWIREKLNKVSGIAKLKDETRVKTYINMASIDLVDFEYEEDEPDIAIPNSG